MPTYIEWTDRSERTETTSSLARPEQAGDTAPLGSEEALEDDDFVYHLELEAGRLWLVATTLVEEDEVEGEPEALAHYVSKFNLGLTSAIIPRLGWLDRAHRTHRVEQAPGGGILRESLPPPGVLAQASDEAADALFEAADL